MPDLRVLFDRLLAAINAHDLETASKFISPDCEMVTPFATLRGPEPFKTYVQGLIDAFPDFKQTVHNTVCEGSTLVTEWTLTGTHQAPLRMPNGSVVPPTGKKMNAHGCDVYTWDGGQITVDRIYRDRLETLIQLGLAPDPAGGGCELAYPVRSPLGQLIDYDADVKGSAAGVNRGRLRWEQRPVDP